MRSTDSSDPPQSFNRLKTPTVRVTPNVPTFILAIFLADLSSIIDENELQYEHKFAIVKA